MVKRCHIVGCSPRSGTTLMHELMISCFALQAGAPHEISLYERPRGITGDYCTKNPSDLIHLARLLDWDMSLYGLYILRDPRDVIVSRHGKFPDRFWVDYGRWQRNQQLIKPLLDHPRMLIVSYEALATDPDAVQAEIAAKFDFLEHRHPFSAYPEVAQPSEGSKTAMRGARKISTKSIGSWKNELPRVKQQLLAYPSMPEELIAAGYEANHDWVALLEDVVPNETLSVGAEHREKNAAPPLLRPAARVARRLGTFGQQVRYILTR